MKFFLRNSRYRFRILTEEDIPQIYDLLLGNPLYFQYCPPQPSHDSIRQDMSALPPGKSYEDKYYGGLFEGNSLISVFDLITKYPHADTLFIGFFMMHRSEQGRGLGTKIISELCRDAATQGFTRIRLGYVKGNPQSEAFWKKNRFLPTGIESQTENYTIVIMERDLSK